MYLASVACELVWFGTLWLGKLLSLSDFRLAELLVSCLGFREISGWGLQKKLPTKKTVISKITHFMSNSMM